MPAMEGQLKKRGTKMPVMHDRYCVATWEINHSDFEKYVLLRSFKTQKGYVEQPAKPSSACTLKSVTDWNGKTSFHHYDHAFQMESTDGQVYYCVAPTALEKSQWLDFMTSGRSYRSNSNADLRQLGRTSSNAELRRLVRTSSSTSTDSNAELRRLGRASSNAELRQLVRTSSCLSTISSNNGSSRSNMPFLDQVWRGPGSTRKHSSSGLVIARKESDVSTDGEFSMDEDVESCESFKADSMDDMGDVVSATEPSRQVKETRALLEDVAGTPESTSSVGVTAVRSATAVSDVVTRDEDDSFDCDTAAITSDAVEVGAENELTSSEPGVDAGVESSPPEPESKALAYTIESPLVPPAASGKEDEPVPEKTVEQGLPSHQHALNQTPNATQSEASVSASTPTATDEEPAIEAVPELPTPVASNADAASSIASDPAPSTQGSTVPIPRPIRVEPDIAAPPNTPPASAIEKPQSTLSRPVSPPSTAAPAPTPSDVVAVEPTSRARSTILPTAAPASLSGRKLVRIGSASTMSAIDEDRADESDEAWLSLVTRTRARSSVVSRAHEAFPSLTRERLRRHSFGSAYSPPTRAAEVFARSSSVKPSFIEPRLGYVHSGLSTIVPSFASLFTSLSRQQSLEAQSMASKVDDRVRLLSSMDQSQVIDEV